MNNNIRISYSKGKTSYLWVLPVTLIVFNLSLLWLARGRDLTGWELLGSADAALRFVSVGTWEVLIRFWKNSHNFQYWTTISSNIFGALPGYLATIYPWIMWPSVVVLLAMLVTWSVLPKLLKLDSFYFYAATASSGTLTSYALMGHPYGPVIIPYAIAFTIIFKYYRVPISIRFIVLETLLWCFIFQFASEVSTPARSIALLPFHAALFLKNTKISRKIYWIIIGTVMFIGYSMYSSNALDLGFLNNPSFDYWTSTKFAVYWIYRAFYDSRVEQSSFIVIGFFALIILRQNKLFWLSLVVSQYLLLILLSYSHLQQGYVDYEFLRARRFVLFSFILSLIIANAGTNNSPIKRRVLMVAVFTGMIFQVAYSISYYINPIPNRSLPLTDSCADFFVSKDIVNDAAHLAQFASQESMPQVVLYGFSRFVENTTDPAAFIERVVMEIGPQRFISSFRFIDGWSLEPHRCRYTCIPSYQISDLDQMLLNAKCHFYLHVYKDPFCSENDCLTKSDVLNDSSWLGKILNGKSLQMNLIDNPTLIFLTHMRLNACRSFDFRFDLVYIEESIFMTLLKGT